MSIELFGLITVFMSDDADGYILALLFAGPAAGVWFFKQTHKKYRNFDETHGFEQETTSYVQNMKKTDNFTRAIKKTDKEFTVGRNSDNHRIRVKEF